MLDVVWTSAFKKDYKKAIKQGKDISILDSIIRKISNEETLDEKFKDHSLVGNYKGYRECHISPDWLLIYSIQKDVLILVLSRTGSHSELFKKM